MQCHSSIGKLERMLAILDEVKWIISPPDIIGSLKNHNSQKSSSAFVSWPPLCILALKHLLVSKQLCCPTCSVTSCMRFDRRIACKIVQSGPLPWQQAVEKWNGPLSWQLAVDRRGQRWKDVWKQQSSIRIWAGTRLHPDVPRRCAHQSGFARAGPHPHAGLLISALKWRITESWKTTGANKNLIGLWNRAVNDSCTPRNQQRACLGVFFSNPCSISSQRRSAFFFILSKVRHLLFIIGSAEALPILSVRYIRWEREREREK